MKRFRHELTRHGSLLAARVVQQQQELAVAWRASELADRQRQTWQQAIVRLDEASTSERVYGKVLEPLGAPLAARCAAAAATATTARANYLAARSAARAVGELLIRARARHDRGLARAEQRELAELFVGRSFEHGHAGDLT
jgi:hypothetical protein